MKMTSETAEIIRRKDAQIEDLKRQVDNLQAMIFGSQSEKQSVISEENPQQLFLNFEGVHSSLPENDNPASKPEKESQSSSTKKNKKKGGGNQLSLPENLETEEIHVDVADDEKVDPITGEAFSLIDEEITEKLVRVKASYKLIRLIRPVYGARKSGIVKADLPLSVFGFSKLDESFWAEVLVRRTCDHLPFNRQVQILARDGINITRQCLSKTYINTGGTLQDLGRLLKKNILSLPVIHVDETTIKMQMPGKKSLHTAYLWVLAGRPANFEDKEPLVWMDFKTNRKHENAEELIEDYNKVMHSDVFQGYEKLADKGQFTWAPCWVHARRKFIKATENDFQKEVIAKFTAIMAKDNEADLLKDQDKVDFRHRHVEPMVDELISFLEKEEITTKVMISKSLSNACSYFLKRKQHFKNFLKHPKAEMDNNAAERSIRPLKIGNKNWLFIGSQAGGEACAVMTSLLQSAKNIGLNPQEYIENVLRRIPYTPKERLSELLPQNWTKKINPRSPFLPPDYKVQ
jgi:transposase